MPPEPQQTQVQGYVIPVVVGEPNTTGVTPVTNVYYINDDPACNMYWVFFFLGFLIFPLFWICGAVGIRSPKHNEMIAGRANMIALGFFAFLVIVYALLVAL